MAWTPTQECAMDLGNRDLLISAVAGAGKTATLTERIIRSLTAPEGDPRRMDISRMLVVTFTRAAAAELRTRISEALLKQIASTQDKGMRAHLNDQLLKLSNAHISTIDSFYLDVVRANFERLELPAGFRLIEDSELLPFKEQLLYRIVENAYCASAPQGQEFNPDSPLDALNGNAFALAMDNLIANRDQGNLPEILLKLHEQLMSYPKGISLLSESADRMEKEADLPVLQSKEGAILLDFLLPLLADLESSLQRAVDSFTATPSAAKKTICFSSPLCAIQALHNALKDGDWDAARLAVIGFESEGNLKGLQRKFAPDDYDECRRVREIALKLLQDKLLPYFEFDSADCARAMKQTALTQRAIHTILSSFEKELLKEKKRRAAFEFSDIRTFMLQLLMNEDGTPTDIATSLCRQFDAVYIDEYQDVDAVQDRIFALIGKGGKRFMVGDIKQSIYGFRGSEPSLFTGYKNTFPLVSSKDDPNLSPNGNHVSMAHNFRCDDPIVKFTNDVCTHLLEVCPRSLAFDPETDNLKTGKDKEVRIDVPVQLVHLTESAQAKKSAPADMPPPEALYIAEEIHRLIQNEYLAPTKDDPVRRPIRARDIAILVRAEKGAEHLVNALKKYGIAADFAPRANLASHPNMTMMVNLLSVIDNPHDDYPLMGLLSCQGSPIELGEILTVRSKKSTVSLYENLKKAVEDGEASELCESTRDKLAAFFGQLDEWRALAATLPIDKLLRNVYAHPAFATLASDPALLSIYDHARSFQSSSFCGLYQFLQHFRHVLENPKNLSTAGLGEKDNAVKIMTIHHAKGLQFPVVFLYNCSRIFSHKDESAPIAFDRDLGAATALYSPATASMTGSLTRAVIRRRMYERSREEEMRALYVALTRARERLYLIPHIGKATEQNANAPVRNNRYHVLSASSYAAWVLSALAEPNLGRKTDPAVVNIQTVNAHDLVARATESPDTASTDEESANAENTAPRNADAEFYRDILQAHESYVDPRAAIRRLPTKAAASKLRSSMLDEVWLVEEFGSDSEGQKSRDGSDSATTQAYVKNRIALMRRADSSFDTLLRESREASAAERGTATHLFLQHCDFARLAREGIDAELATLVEQGHLPRRAADIIHRERLAALLKSDLFSLLSRPDVTLYRELHFDRFIPYAHLTRNEALIKTLADYTLYVQGSLDLLVKEADGTLWLCDYKTDAIRGESEQDVRAQFLTDHADQLRIYAEAVEGLFGRRPDHVLIYSLPLGRSIELTDDI